MLFLLCCLSTPCQGLSHFIHHTWHAGHSTTSDGSVVTAATTTARAGATVLCRLLHTIYNICLIIQARKYQQSQTFNHFCVVGSNLCCFYHHWINCTIKGNISSTVPQLNLRERQREREDRKLTLLYAVGFKKTGQLRSLLTACRGMVAVLIIIFFECPVHLIKNVKGLMGPKFA